MVGREIEKTLTSWGKRHGLRVSDVYRDTFYYVDVVDDVGGNYEISISKDGESDSFKVRVWNHQKKSRGFIPVDLPELEEILEKAYSQIITWMKQSKGTRIFAP
jgi:hypothetical protein